MPVNLDKPQLWKADIAKSVDHYNEWFLKFAPKAFREQRHIAAGVAEGAFKLSDNVKVISPAVILSNPSVLPILRMACCPPVARERLAGLSYVPKTFIDTLDKHRKIPKRMKAEVLQSALENVCKVLNQLIDPDIFVWRGENRKPTDKELERALTIVADRLCGAAADPIIRNAQEVRQLTSIKAWLSSKGYRFVEGKNYTELKPGEFGFHIGIPVSLSGAVPEVEEEEVPPSGETDDEIEGVNVSVDVVVMPRDASADQMPLLIEAKSAGDFTNVNKRRKEEAKKVQQLVNTYGSKVKYILFLCGYFNSGYLGYEAADGIDWVWEHRIEDLNSFGL